MEDSIQSDHAPLPPAGGDNAAQGETAPAEAARLKALLEQARAREDEARRALAALTRIVDALPVGVTVQSEDGAPLFSNGKAVEFFGKTGFADQPPVAASRDGGTAMTETPILHAGGVRTLLTMSRPVRIREQPVLLSATLDFTERKVAEMELSKRAYFDDLTGLPNRTLIQDHVEQLLRRANADARFALAFIDIDNFKHINDYYTHAIGDMLLVKVAQTIAAHLRPSDIVGRISGDEFLMILHPVESDDDLADVVDRLLVQLKEPFLIEGYEILTSASIGVSVYPDHGLNYEMLRRAADTAMYRVKAGIKGGAALFDSDMERQMKSRMAQEQRLRLAVRDGRFCCAFQPKVEMRTEKVVGVEALIRLRDEDGMIQMPGAFIKLATELGLIGELTFLALHQIEKSIALIDEAFGAEATISINVAAQQAGDVEFMQDFCKQLGLSGHAGRFMVEVTEEAFVASNRFQSHILPILREIGARVSIDDFGTGYSSLAVLADITADEIKIDRSFITNIHQRSRSQSVLKAIEALSDDLGMTTIAEGVETYEEAAYLQAATRIRLAQGFYYSKPILLEELNPAKGGAGAQRASASPRERAHSRGPAFGRR